MPRRNRSGRFTRATRTARRAGRRVYRRFNRKPGLIDLGVAVSPQIEDTLRFTGGITGALKEPEQALMTLVDRTTGYNLKWQKFDNTEAAKANAIKSVKRSIGWWIVKGLAKTNKTGRSVLAWGRKKKIGGFPLWR